MKSATLILFSFTGILFSIAQVNLVPNPSFEMYSSCPTSSGQITYSNNWMSPTLGTPDYYNSCSSVMSVPVQGPGLFQNAADGNAFAGIWCYYDASQYREYIQVMLSDTLKSGDSYDVSFKVNLMNGCQYSISTMGLVLSNSPISSGCSNCLLSYSPQIENPASDVLSDTLGWTIVSGTYVANGGERYVTIGNFKSDANSNAVYDSDGIYNEAYYLIDDISVTRINVGIDEHNNSYNINVFPNPSTGALKFTYNRMTQDRGEVEIYDLTGKKLKTYPLKDYENTLHIDDLSVDNGIYFYRITINGSIVRSDKLMIIK